MSQLPSHLPYRCFRFALCCVPRLIALLTALGLTTATARAEWLRHTIDSGGRGADGVRLADLDGDGRLDIVTPWEEEGEIRVYFNPGPARCRANWPRVTVGRVKSPEDAVMVDLDGDFVLDVVSCAEGATRLVQVHWGPVGPELLRDAGSWTSQSIPALDDLQMWMFAVPLDIDGQHELDLVVGGKGAKAGIGWVAAPDEARQLSRCSYHPLRPAGWIMSLVARTTWTATVTRTCWRRIARGRAAACSGWKTQAPNEPRGLGPGPSMRWAASNVK